jgi:predicted transcriptional regulator
MNGNQNKENLRAERIFFRINQNHQLLTDVYEKLVDRDFKPAEKDIKDLITDLRLILKSIEEDDF